MRPNAGCSKAAWQCHPASPSAGEEGCGRNSLQGRMSQREHSQGCSFFLMLSFSQKSHLPLSPGQSLATSTAVVRVQQPLVPAAAQAVTVNMCFWFSPSHSISQGTFKRPSAEVLFPREGIREFWECHIQGGEGDWLFLGTKCPSEFLLAFCHGNFSLQYFNTLENSLVNLFVLLTTSK